MTRTITVLGGEEGSFKGYFWTYIGDAQHPYSVYDFTNSRSRDGPAKFLKSYSGYLHADAYTGYDAMFSDVGSKVIEVACWSHYPEFGFIWRDSAKQRAA